MGLTWQLINGISRVPQNLLKHFNGPIILTSFLLPSAGVFPVISVLGLNDSKSIKLSFGSSLQCCNKLRLWQCSFKPNVSIGIIYSS